MANSDEDRIKNNPNNDERDPHPVGTGVGAAGAAAAGAAIGSAGGPIGAIVGGAVGAIVGGVAGSAAGEAIDPTVEDTYWRENSAHQPYYKSSQNTYPDLDYDRDYRHA
ncbi:MAG: hypothetical protein WCD22_06130, partial [Acinetobacter sp.]